MRSREKVLRLREVGERGKQSRKALGLRAHGFRRRHTAFAELSVKLQETRNPIKPRRKHLRASSKM